MTRVREPLVADHSRDAATWVERLDHDRRHSTVAVVAAQRLRLRLRQQRLVALLRFDQQQLSPALALERTKEQTWHSALASPT
jgi:hypothetical protein